MATDHLALFLGQLAGCVKDLAVDAELADVAEERRDVEVVLRARVDAEPLRDRARHAGHALARSGEHRLIALDGEAERIHDPGA